VNVGAQASIGRREKSEHISFEEDYLSILTAIYERYFVFYDVDKNSRRAWLLDGASALLHLLRAFFVNSRTKSPLKKYFVFKEDQLVEGQNDTAFDILANARNQLLPLWEKPSTPNQETEYFCLKDRVLQICRVLQQATAHYDNIEREDGFGFRITCSPRRQLTGFDFRDVATLQGTIWPHVTPIDAMGEGWVDFTRELHCVTLFGTGFGELMKPVGIPCQLCMSNIPQGPDLLAIQTSDLLKILEKGDMSRRPWRVLEDIHWYVPDKLFERCVCRPSASKRDRVQVFIPTTRPRFWGSSSPESPQLAPGGAILIGHSFKLPLRWKDNRREPERGEPQPSHNRRMSPSDSGIGSGYASEEVMDSVSLGGQSRSQPRPGIPSHELASPDSAIAFHPNHQFLYHQSS
jgi:hypothetical protein